MARVRLASLLRPTARLLLAWQVGIGVVAVLGVLECATWYLDYRAFNAGGVRGGFPVTIGVLCSTLRKTISRLLVLVVCLGHRVLRPALDTASTYRLVGLGALYFVFSSTLDVASNLSQITEVLGLEHTQCTPTPLTFPSARC